jgi:hypothetical protein
MNETKKFWLLQVTNGYHELPQVTRNLPGCDRSYLILHPGAISPALTFVPIQGTKNLRADLISLTRPLRPLVKFAISIMLIAPTVKIFFVFSSEPETRRKSGLSRICFSGGLSTSLPLFISQRTWK